MGAYNSKLWSQVDPITGKSKSKIRGEKSREGNLNNIDENGNNGFQRGALKSSKTKKNIDPVTGMTISKTIAYKVVASKKNNIDENGLDSIQIGTIKMVKTRKIKDENGLTSYTKGGYLSAETRALNGNYMTGKSKEATNMIKEIISHFYLDQNMNYELYYGDDNDKNKREWTQYINKPEIKAGAYDFVIRLKDTKNIILVIEYHGSCWHINKEKYDQLVENNIDETCPFGGSLKDTYIRDQIKKQHMIEKYGCEYIEIFDYEWKDNKEEILKRIGNIL